MKIIRLIDEPERKEEMAAWFHRLMIMDTEILLFFDKHKDADDELMSWIKAAAAFSDKK